MLCTWQRGSVLDIVFQAFFIHCWMVLADLPVILAISAMEIFCAAILRTSSMLACRSASLAVLAFSRSRLRILSHV